MKTQNVSFFTFCAILLLLCFTPFRSNSQANKIVTGGYKAEIDGKVLNYYKKYPVEKIFLHTDRNHFLNGDTIWYKIYTMAYGKPSVLSKLVYVRLQDSAGNIIRQDIQQLTNGVASGNINLPDSIATGTYKIFVFSNWMLNLDREAINHYVIKIKNLSDIHGAAKSVKRSSYSIRFYPEGGDLTADNFCNVAFKATDETGMPVDVHGDVFDTTQKLVAKIACRHDGMGTFEIKTGSGSDFHAVVNFPDGSTRQIDLPKVKKEGLNMRVLSSADDEINLLLVLSGQKEEHKDITVTALQTGGNFMSYPLKLDKGPNVFSFKKKDFSTGTLRLTVFDERQIPLAERIIYIDRHDFLNISVNTAEQSENGHMLNVMVKDGKGDALDANTSVSIADASVSSESDQNIASYFLLTSELHGYIHNPAYYFKNNSDSLKQQLDLVMLTNGWRRFRWQQILKDQDTVINFGPEQSLGLAGKVQNYDPKNHWRLNLLFVNSDSTKNIASVQPDDSGRFEITGYVHRGTSDISFQLVNEKNHKQAGKVIFFRRAADTIRFPEFDSQESLAYSFRTSKGLLDSMRMERQFRVNTTGHLLKTVEIKAKGLTPIEQLIKNYVRTLQTDQAYTLDLIHSNPASSSGLIGYIQGKFPGLLITPSGDGMGASNFVYHGPTSITTASRGPDEIPNEPYFYVDEAEVGANDALSIPLTDIALIRYAPPPVWFAPLNGGPTGALLIYTKRFGNEKGNGRTMSNFGLHHFQGYAIVREFHPVDVSSINVEKPNEFGPTFLWQHDFNTLATRNENLLQFKTASATKKIRVVIQAMNKEGKVGFLNETITLK